MILHNNQEDTMQQQKEWKLACAHVKVYTGTRYLPFCQKKIIAV